MQYESRLSNSSKLKRVIKGKSEKEKPKNKDINPKQLPSIRKML
jgi:hypothetical protein